MTNLNKDFFNELEFQNPKAMVLFGVWMYEYAKGINWRVLFGRNQPLKDVPKFHDIPFELQIGILCSFFKQYQMFIIKEESFNEFEIKENIKICFKQLNEKLVNA